jgi:hypothetical protein
MTLNQASSTANMMVSEWRLFGQERTFYDLLTRPAAHAYKALNEQSTENWFDGAWLDGRTSAGRVVVQLPQPIVVQRYILRPTQHPSLAYFAMATAWTLEGSPDGRRWTVVDSNAYGSWDGTTNTRRVFTASRPNTNCPYAFWTLRPTRIGNAVRAYRQMLGALLLFESPSGLTPAIPRALTANLETVTDVVDAKGTYALYGGDLETYGREYPPDGWLSFGYVSWIGIAFLITGMGYGNGYYRVRTDTKTLNNDSTFHPYKLFNKGYGVSDGWHTKNNLPAGSRAWASLQLPNRICLKAYQIQQNNNWGLNDSPRDWLVEGSHDQVTWVRLDQRSDERFAANNQAKTYVCRTPSKDYFRHFRMVAISNARTDQAKLVSNSRCRSPELVFQKVFWSHEFS